MSAAGTGATDDRGRQEPGRRRGGKKPEAAAGALNPALRKRAEELLKSGAATPGQLAPADLEHTLHELRVHQIELEMQNEQLRSTQLELEAARAKYFDLYELAPVGYVTLDEAGRIIDANLTAARILAAERADIVGRPLTAFIAGGDQDTYYLFFRDLVDEAGTQTSEVRLRSTEDEPVWLRLDATPLAVDERGVCATRMTITDVSEARSAGEAIARLLAMRDTAEHVGRIGTWSVDLRTWQMHWSPEMLRLLDIDGGDEEGLREQIVARVHPGDRERVREYLADLTQAWTPRQLEFRVVHRDGFVLTLWGDATLERDATGKAAQMVGFLQDITERRRAEAEILRLQQALERRLVARTEELDAATHELEALAYAIAHDVRAPLRAIDGFSAMVIQDDLERLSPESADHLERVRLAAQRMGDLMDALLGLSNVSRRLLDRCDVDLSGLARAIADEQRETAPHRDVAVVVQEGMHGDADPALLRIVLRELLDNAWKFTAPHERARIEVGETRSDGERVYFVRDDGVGYDPVYAEHLFGAFQRMHSKEQFAGIGIGLATVQRLVGRHGGRVWAEAAVEQGATFYFTLPPAEGAPSASD